MSTMEIICEEMRKHKITARKLCQELDINEGTFSCWKAKDVEPRLVEGLKIITYLSIPASRFIGGEPEPEPEPENRTIEERLAELERKLNKIDASA